MAIPKEQRQQLEDFRAGKIKYEDAALYTVLLDLIESSDVLEVFAILHEIATHKGKRKELESNFKHAKGWKWK